MINAPVVDSPVVPCMRKVRVSTARTGATVTLFESGVPIGHGVADGPTAFIPLDAGFTLTSGRLVTASQELDGDISPPTPDSAAAKVLKAPTFAMLGSLISRSQPLQCGECLWLEGIVPGATVTVQVGNDPPIVKQADWIALHVDVPPLAMNTPVRVQQTACGIAGPTILLPPTLQQTRELRIDPPSVDTPLYRCQRALTVHVLPGAQVTLDQSGNPAQFCFGLDYGIFWLGQKLDITDRITLKQTLLHCELESDPSEYGVIDQAPLPPGFPYPVCVGDPQVELTGLLRGAFVQFLLGDESQPFFLAEAGIPPWRFNLPPLGDAQRLGVRQAVCEDGPWSEAAFVDLIPAGPADTPAILEPVFACGSAVGVKSLSLGTRVRVVSELWGGPIGEAVGDGDEFADVPLYFTLDQGDRLNLETIHCGDFQALGDVTTVQTSLADLLPPEMDDPVDDYGGRIHMRKLVPGAMVDFERVASPLTLPSEAGLWIGSSPVTMFEANVAVPPLELGWFIRARLRLCEHTSGPSSVSRVEERVIQYEPNSTFRICQLTGKNDPDGRPHPFDTTNVDLFGTDLGIPVEHQGRLFIFFGDCKEGVQSEANSDPISWTTSSPEPDGPNLHWLLNGEGVFRRLIIEDQPTMGVWDVPTGGFGYSGRLYLFISRDHMQTSHLTVTKPPDNDPNLNMLELYKVATTMDGGASAPAGAWLIHVSPTVVNNADWPGLPQSTGQGLIMFGTSIYQKSNVYLAWAPLTPGQDPPHPSTWLYYKVDRPGQWAAGPTIPAGEEPTPLLFVPPGQPPPVAELSVTWQPRMRRWLMTHIQGGPGGSNQAVLHTARKPWGPWIGPVVIFDGVNSQFDADAKNLQPGNQFVGFPHASEPRNTAVYAPYIIPRWTHFDRSLGMLKLYYTLSVEDPPYNPQLMRSILYTY